MEQFLSFLAMVILLMTALFIVESPVLFLVFFFVGATYLLLRGKTKGWVWPKRP